jgi:cysteine desulfurase / selenocysteine lyase
MFYLDNAATSWPKPEIVYQTLDSSFRSMFSPKRGTASASRLGGDRLNQARESVAKMFNIENPSRVVFTGGATHALNMAIQGFPWNAGDGVVISAVEHHALSRPIRKMAREKGIRFFVVPYTDELPFDLGAYEALLKAPENQIRLVATTHASNVIGSVLPVSNIGALAKRYGVPYLVDAAQTAGVLPVDVQEMNIDLLALPGHKSLYGPPGVGVFYIGESIDLNPFMEGGTGGDSGQHELNHHVPDSYEVGTIAMPLILALAAGVNWVEETGLSNIHHHEMELLADLLNGLAQIPELTIYGHQDLSLKTPVVSFNVKGIPPKDLGAQLFEEHGIALRGGFHCAPMAHEAIGSASQKGTLRASIGYFTKPEDVQALIQSLKQVLVSL